MSERRGSRPLASAMLRLGLLAAVLGGLLIAVAASGIDLSPERLRRAGEGINPLLFVPAVAILNCLLVPSPALIGASGLLFGTWVGGLVGHAGIVLAACSQLLITRYLARDQVAALLPQRAHRFDAFLERRGFFAVLYVRLVPAMPFPTLNYASGLTRLRLWHMAAGTALAKAPRSFAYAALGGNIDDLSRPEARVAIAVIVGLGLLGALLATRQAAQERRRERSAVSSEDGARAE